MADKLRFYNAEYCGIQCTTPRGYLFLLPNGKGVWIARSMTYNLVIHNDNYVTATHPTCIGNSQEVTINDVPKYREHTNQATEQYANPYMQRRGI